MSSGRLVPPCSGHPGGGHVGGEKREGADRAFDLEQPTSAGAARRVGTRGS